MEPIYTHKNDISVFLVFNKRYSYFNMFNYLTDPGWPIHTQNATEVSRSDLPQISEGKLISHLQNPKSSSVTFLEIF